MIYERVVFARGGIKCKEDSWNLYCVVSWNIKMLMAKWQSIIGYMFINNLLLKIISFIVYQPPSGPGPPHYRHFMIILRHTTFGGPSGWEVILTQRPLPDNTQHLQETDIHAPDGIWTRNPSKQAAADPHPTSLSYWGISQNNSTLCILSSSVAYLKQILCILCT